MQKTNLYKIIMSFFNKISLTLLNYAQRVVTTTVGKNIGINDIFQQIEANFDDIDRVLNPNIGGGGLDGSNFKPNSITSDKIKLNSTKAIQSSYIKNHINQNGQGAFSPIYTVCNTTFVVTGTGSINILINSNMQHKIDNSAGNNLCNIQHEVKISTSPSFTSTVATRLRTKKIMDNGNGIWTNDETIINEIFTVTSGTYYIKSSVWGDGNTSCGFETMNSTLSIIQL
jgi:hypothetical protein